MSDIRATKLSYWDKIALAIGFSTLAIGILALLVAHRQLSIEETAAARHPNIEIRFAGIPLPVGAQRRQPGFFLLAAELRPKRLLSFPLVFSVTNTGDKTADNVVMMVTYPKRLRFGGIGQFTYEGPQSYKSDLADGPGTQTVIFQLGSINPNQKIVIHDAISISESTLVTTTATVTTKDNVKVDLSVVILYANRIDFAISNRDFQPIAGSASIAFFDTAKRPLKDQLSELNNAAQKRYDSAYPNFFRKYWHYLKSRWSGEQVLEAVHLIKCDESKRRSDGPFDEFADDAMLVGEGVKDITGSIYVVGGCREIPPSPWLHAAALRIESSALQFTPLGLKLGRHRLPNYLLDAPRAISIFRAKIIIISASISPRSIRCRRTRPSAAAWRDFMVPI
jgi:hypothetical protein